MADIGFCQEGPSRECSLPSISLPFLLLPYAVSISPPLLFSLFHAIRLPSSKMIDKIELLVDI